MKNVTAIRHQAYEVMRMIVTPHRQRFSAVFTQLAMLDQREMLTPIFFLRQSAADGSESFKDKKFFSYSHMM